MPGYWLVRWRTGHDVREQGSGGTGATNVGRVLGGAGFLVVLLLDALKGALAVLAARWLCGADTWVPWAAGLAVVTGHVWPVFLSFRGGKGVATLIGAWLVLQPAAFLFCVPVFAVAWLFLRRFTLAGLCGLCLLPTGTAWAAHWAKFPALWAGLCLLVILLAHKEHLRRWLHPETASQ